MATVDGALVRRVLGAGELKGHISHLAHLTLTLAARHPGTLAAMETSPGGAAASVAAAADGAAAAAAAAAFFCRPLPWVLPLAGASMRAPDGASVTGSLALRARPLLQD